MLKALLITALVLNLCIVAKSDDPPAEAPAAGANSPGAVAGVDYCTLKCDQEENSACKCVDDEVACGGPPKILTLDDTLRAYALKLHNEYREKVASGTEKQGGNVGGTDIQVMVYDKELEYVAECYNRKCNGDHDKCRLTSKWKADEHQVGQNMYGGYEEPCDKYVVNSSQYYWYEGEVNESSVECIMNYDKCDMHRIGHYTQMIWATTTHVGCSLVEFTPKGGLVTCHFFCNYGPSGNWGGKRIYTLGPPARDCKSTDPTFKSLCVGPVVSGEHDLSAAAEGYRFESLGYIFTTILSFAAFFYYGVLSILNVGAY